MPTEHIAQTSKVIDFTDRVKATTTVVASPAAAAETIVATLPTYPADLTIVQGIILNATVSYTVGTNGTAVQFKIRQTGLAGTIVGNTGAMTGSQHGAAILTTDDVGGFDASPPSPVVYVVTMQVTAGSAASTISSLLFFGIAV